jgi:hypothetical protein
MHRSYVQDRCFHSTKARSPREGNSNTVHKIYSAELLATNVSISCHIPQLRNPISSRRSTNIPFIRLTAQKVIPNISLVTCASGKVKWEFGDQLRGILLKHCIESSTGEHDGTGTWSELTRQVRQLLP